MNVIKSCGAPLTGTLFFGAGGAIDSTVGIGFNLDSSDTEAEQAEGEDYTSWKPDYFARYTISLQAGQQQVFDLYASTWKHSCTFQYQMMILDGDRTVNELIGNGSTPFRVTALAGAGVTGGPMACGLWRVFAVSAVLLACGEMTGGGGSGWALAGLTHLQ